MLLVLTRVDKASDDGVLDAVVVELVVRPQCGQGPRSNGVGEEDLSGGVYPALGVPELAPVRSDVEQEACPRPLQSDGFEEEGYDDEVGEQSREPDYLKLIY